MLELFRRGSLARNCIPSVVREVRIREWLLDPRVQILTLPPASCVALSKLLGVSLPYRICCEN